MRLSPTLVFVSTIGFASTNTLIYKRASISDQATVGYATLNGGTTGEGMAARIVVTTLPALKTAVTGNSAKVVMISGTISGDEVIKVGSNTSLLEKPGATLNGIGLRLIDISNVIIRNLKISKVLADAGDYIGLQSSNRVWVDSVELWSDREHAKDYHDGLLDITHGVYATSITNSYLHDHWKASLVGHSDSNEAEDQAIQVTHALNKWQNLNSRTPSFRFGHGHIFNNYFVNNNDGINTRVGAEVLVENNVFENVTNPLYSTDAGYANATGNDFGGAANTADPTSWNSVGYPYKLLPTSQVKTWVNLYAGAKLSFTCSSC